MKLDQSVIFAGFLEYILMQQCKLNNDIKHFFYGVLNESTDDQSKGQVISLLELLFNPKQEK